MELPESLRKQIKRAMELGMIRVSQVHNRKISNCFEDNKTNMKGFVSCVDGYLRNEEKMAPLIEHRMNWVGYQYKHCIQTLKRSKEVCEERILGNLDEIVNRSLGDLEFSN